MFKGGAAPERPRGARDEVRAIRGERECERERERALIERN